MVFIDQRQAEEAYQKWRKEHPEEAAASDKQWQEMKNDNEKLLEFLKSKGFQFSQFTEQVKMPLHPKIGKEIFLKPAYCVIIRDEYPFETYSGKPEFVTIKPVLRESTGERQVQIHIRLIATHSRGHIKLDKPLAFDIDCYVAKEGFEKQIEKLLQTKQTVLV